MDYSKWDNIDTRDPDVEEKEPLEYNIDSDGEPPTDEIGDIKRVVSNQVFKEIVKVGDGLSKPGKPYIV